MNSVNLIGRMTKNTELRWTNGGTAVISFSLAVDGQRKEDGSKDTDFPSCVAYGKIAENIHKYFTKGQRIAVSGRIRTGSYEKDGRKIYTTDVVVEKFDFIEKREAQETQQQAQLSEVSDADEDGELPF